MRTELVQKQTFKLKMTPQQLQAMKMLQLSGEELTGYLRDRAMENPLLNADAFSGNSAYTSADAARSTTDVIEETLADRADFRRLLQRELGQTYASARLRAGAGLLIEALNEAGYLDDEPLALLSPYGFSAAEAEAALHLVQTLEPAGVGARSLTECLLLQLRRLRPRCALAERIVGEFSTVFLTGKWEALALLLACSEAEISAAVALVRGLDPRPAAALADDLLPCTAPDLTFAASDGALHCQLNDELLPAVSYEREAYEQLMQKADRAARRYLREKKAEAEALLAGLSRRGATLLAIGELILKVQQRYLLSGSAADLRAYTMKQAAGQLGVHPSTISRAVAGKYALTPHGLLALKLFFPRPLPKAKQPVAAASIRQAIRTLIAAEDRRHPLSDQQLAERLRLSGMICSRRVVAKYRTQAGLCPGAARRERYSAKDMT
ncbi:MAG: RNA polymerase factor sigma-54 [Sporolactobacillus sp.]